jgi:tetratricopeptide (TPR) repeat protein
MYKVSKMHATKANWLFRAALLAGLLLTGAWPSAAQVSHLRSAARSCANQSAKLADQRIDACTQILSAGRLSGKPLGVAYALRGLAHLDRGDVAAAIIDLDRAVQNAPDFAPAFQNRGNARYAQGDSSGALADYDRAIKLDPGVASAYVNRAWLHSDLGKTRAALADFDKAIRLSPDNAGAYSGRGELYLQQKQYGNALADLNRAVRLAPTAQNHKLREEARAELRQAERAAQKQKKEKADAAEAAAAASAAKRAEKRATAKPPAVPPPPAQPNKKAVRANTERRAAAPPPRPSEHSQRKPLARRASAPPAAKRLPRSGVWIDQHGRPLSAREVREIQRLMRQSQSPVRYYPPRRPPSFSDIFR